MVKVEQTSLTAFIELIKNFNVIGMALGIVIGQSIVELSNAFIDTVLMPTVDPFFTKITGKDQTIDVYFFTIHLSKFISALIKFFSILILLFIMLQFGIQFAKPIEWVSIRSIAPDVKLK